jgi:ABC-type uncharacterized transport system substrate-binding protein
MRRREFIALFGAAAVLSVGARAQQPAKTYHIAIVDSARKVANISESDPDWGPFFRELRLLGYVEGRNLIVERRSGEGKPERYADLAQEAVALRPDVIVSLGSALAAQLKSATQTIPIVATVGNPVGSGLVASLARPGGNITGLSIDAGLGVYSKSLEILRSINPSMSKVALLGNRWLWDTSYANESFDENEYRRVIAAFVSNGAEGVIVSPLVELWSTRRQFVGLLNNARLPAIYPYPDYVRDGGLIAYSLDLEESTRLSAQYVDRILKGANPAELPFLQPTKFRTMINLKTARALGLEIPAPLVASADEVIE